MASAFGFGVLLMAWVPVYVSAVNVTAPVIRDSQGLGAVGPYEPIDLEIEAERPGTIVQLPPPVAAAVRGGPRQVDLGGWRADPAHPNQAVSDGVPAVMHIDGAFNSLDFAFQTGPRAGRVEMRLSGAEPAVIDLREPEVGARIVTATSGHSRTTTSRRFGWQAHRLKFDQPVDRVEGVTFGSLPLTYRASLSPDGQVLGVHIAQNDVVRAVTGMAGRAAPLALLAGMITAVALGLGTLLEVVLSRSTCLRWAGPERLAAGLASGMVVLGALNYYVPVSWILPVVIALGASGLYLEARRQRIVRWETHLEAAVLTGFVLAVVAIPFVVTDRWAIGHLQTDVHDTFNLTQLFWNHSALDANTDFGNGFRLLDYSARAAVAGWMRPSDAVAVLRIILTAVMVPLSWALASRLCQRRLLRLVFTCGISLSAPLLSLYAEGYMTREFFANWMMIGLALLLIALHEPASSLADWAPAAMGLAVAASVVPPYFIPAPAAIIVVLLTRLLSGRTLREIGRSYAKPATGAALVFIVAAVPNLLWVRNAGDAQRYIPALNALARVTVIPFYDSIQFPMTLVGALPFHAHNGHSLGMPSNAVAPGALLVAARFLERSAVSQGFLALLVLTLIGSVVAVVRRPRRDLRSALIDATWLSMSVVVILGFVALRLSQWNEQTYFVLMWAWTLAPVGVLLLAIGMARASAADHPFGRRWAAIGLTLLMLTNLTSAVLEGSRWLENPRGAIASRWHFDLASDLIPFARSLDDGTVPLDDDFQIVERASALTGTDDDRILANVLVGLLIADGHHCVNCRRTSDTYNLLLDDVQVDVNRPSLVIGGRRCPGSVVYQGERFVLCGAGG